MSDPPPPTCARPALAMAKPVARVAKYEGGVRQVLKAKHRDSIDVVCAAGRGRRHAPSAMVVGVALFGRLWIVGATTAGPVRVQGPGPAHAEARPPVAGRDLPTLLDRFTARKEPVRLTRMEPIVVDVSADVAWSARAFRHPLRYLRARPELDPAGVRLPEHLDGSGRLPCQFLAPLTGLPERPVQR
jgi:hypothetical protein